MAVRSGEVFQSCKALFETPCIHTLYMIGIDQKDEGTLDDRRRDGGTNFTPFMNMMMMMIYDRYQQISKSSNCQDHLIGW